MTITYFCIEGTSRKYKLGPKIIRILVILTISSLSATLFLSLRVSVKIHFVEKKGEKGRNIPDLPFANEKSTAQR